MVQELCRFFLLQTQMKPLYFDCNSDSINSMQFPLKIHDLKKNMLDGPRTDGRTDGQALIYRCVDSYKNLAKRDSTTLSHLEILLGLSISARLKSVLRALYHTTLFHMHINLFLHDPLKHLYNRTSKTYSTIDTRSSFSPCESPLLSHQANRLEFYRCRWTSERG